jgi:branched-chain amino acid transport system permease protein
MDKTNKWSMLSIAALAAIAVVLPLVVTSSFAINIFIRILLFSFIGVAWNLMGGYAKQLSLGHAAYFGLGAYTSTIMQVDFGISPWIGMVAGGVAWSRCWRACRSAGCASGCAAPTLRSPPSRPPKP